MRYYVGKILSGTTLLYILGHKCMLIHALYLLFPTKIFNKSLKISKTMLSSSKIISKDAQ